MCLRSISIRTTDPQRANGRDFKAHFLMKFSIITPHFRQLDWLSLCIMSVADQGGDSGLVIEHIIQDAGTPGIENFARCHGAAFYKGDLAATHVGVSTKSPSYSLSIFSEKDSGMYNAINRGFRRASGDILAWLNADEQYLCNSLAKVAVAASEHAACEMFLGDVVVTNTLGEYICSRTGIIPTRLHSLVSGNLSFLSAANFFRRSVIDRALYLPDGWRVVGDGAWTTELLASGVNMRRIPQYLASFVDTGDNLCLRPEAAEEMARLAKLAPRWAQYLRPAIIAWFRVRKLLAGAYRLTPFGYDVFTKAQPNLRTYFEVRDPTQRWLGR
jgi:glycosyltransferase involved in cell wall biosynthesis